MNGLEILSARRLADERRERKRALQEELKLIEEQKVALEKQLQLLNSGREVNGALVKQPSELQPAPSTSKGLKRPVSRLELTLAGPVEAKRQKIEHERQKRVAAIWSQCGTILKALSKAKDAYPFTAPVDPVMLNIPDYLTIIKHPMDLGTVRKKLEHKPEKGIFRKYMDVFQFRDDVRQVWTNCRTYNPAGLPIRIMGDNMSDAWEKKWYASGIEKKWKDEMRRQSEEDEELLGKESGQAIPKKMKQMDVALRQLSAQAEQQMAPAGVKGPDREMNFEEKRKLSTHLGSLPADKLARVLEIIAENKQNKLNAPDEEDEIELDIDSLSNHTLWKLDAYVSEVLFAQQKGSTRKDEKTRTGDNETTSKRSDAYQRTERKSTRKSSDSSSSSSSDDSSSSDEEAQSQENVGSTAPQQEAHRKQSNLRDVNEHNNGTSTFVSATRPPQTQILPPKNSKPQEVPKVNTGAWSIGLFNTPAENGQKEGNNDEGNDALWSEFATREQQQQKRDQEKKDEEERIQREREQEQEAARKEAEGLRKEKEEEEERRRKEEQENIEKKKAEELALLQKLQNSVDLTGQQDVMLGFKTSGNADLSQFGLKMEDDDDPSEDDYDDGEPVEDGELD